MTDVTMNSLISMLQIACRIAQRPKALLIVCRNQTTRSSFGFSEASIGTVADRRCNSYLSDVGKTRMRAKTGRDIKLSWIGSLISHTSVRVREPETPRPCIRSCSTDGSDSSGIKCFAYSCVALVISMVHLQACD